MSQILNHCGAVLNRYDVYAVSRNNDDPSMAKMTPMIPEHRDPEQSFKDDTECSKEYQVQFLLQNWKTYRKEIFSVSSESVTCFCGPVRTIGDIPTKTEVLCRIKLLWSCSVH